MTVSKQYTWVEKRYGSRRGAALTIWHKFLYLLGYYSSYGRVDWNPSSRLVFVCKGNVCRSAYAEAVAKNLGLQAASCGLDTTLGIPANSGAILAARHRGVCLDGHAATPFSDFKIQENDIFIAMEPHQAEILANTLGTKFQLSLLGLWGTSKYPHIHDPFGKSAEYFDQCFSYIEESVNEIAKKTL